MKKLTFALIVAGLLGLGLLLAGSSIAEQLRGETFDPVAEARQRQTIAREEALAPLDLALAAVGRTLPVAAAVIGLALASAWGSLALIRFRRERIPNAMGLLPIVASDQDTARLALGSYHTVRQLEAQRSLVPTVPQSLVYHAPHYRGEPAGLALPAPAESAAELPGVIDLAALPFTPSKDAILLGLGPGGEQITVPMKALWHIALAGPTGNGKSNIARMIVAQLQAIGAKVCIGDPKWTEYDAEQDEDWRPIARRLYREPAYEAKSIASLLRWAAEPEKGELARRLEMRRQGQKIDSPVFIYLDELPWIAEHVKDAAALIGELVRVGRGVGIFLLVGAQDMLAKTINLSAERDNFRTGFYLGGDNTTGAVLLGIPRREVRDPDGMGLAWLRSSATTPPQQLRVPYVSNRAIYGLLGEAVIEERRIGFHVPSGAPSAIHGRTGRGPDTGPDTGPDGASASGRAKPHLDPETIRVLSKFAAGASIHDIVAEIAETANPGDRRYKKVRQRVEEILRTIAAQ